MQFLEKILDREDEKRGGRGRGKPPGAPKQPPPTSILRTCGLSCFALFVLVMGGLALLAVYLLQPAPDLAATAQQAVTPNTAPDVTFTSYEGRTFRLSDFQGNIVVLNFWSPDCAACRTDIYTLQQIQEAYGARGVTVIGLSVNNSDADAQAFLNQFRLTFLNAPDTDRSISTYFNVTSIPQTFIINRDGSLAQSLSLAVDYQRVKTILDTLLANG